MFFGLLLRYLQYTKTQLKMEYLGTYKICPNTKEIDVDCWGTCNPAQNQTLEQEGFIGYNDLEKVTDGDLDITDYLHDSIFSNLLELVNYPK